mmetsp:Transcript_23927/g.39571  ORF Transcript_23927/g.39571 Transcript_23927/m.39571 type:complete len:300 (+) Transcript_23927:134-1033(+)|eukprot:CAMPEP_0119303370 /NCGR_PEP_ID=MMETSP1333-20130426/4811_1 /TAXON_ID=418940 /ORGANISM="Scyphosphaera apsteinii, Strain RCC1455" /LENGTH=299 /DNA_ID=CAMNT_0007306023 /DNA_START=73 /DNA_END=972 /DNA_ORIENTATION=+
MTTAWDRQRLAKGVRFEECLHGKEAFLCPVPEVQPPADTQYNVGTGQYVMPSFLTNGRPRRCRSGSGKPSYSTRSRSAPLATEVPPPVAGAFIPKPSMPAKALRHARDNGSLPLRIDDTPNGPSLRWLIPPGQANAEYLLPLLLEGMCESEPQCRFIALQGAIDLLQAVGPSGELLPVLPATVPAMRAAFSTQQPPVLCVALKMLRQVLLCHERAGLALRPHYHQLLPSIAPIVLRGQRSLGDGIDYAQFRRLNLADLAAEALETMEAHGGEGAGSEIKAYIATFHKAEEPLHRGFRAK